MSVLDDFIANEYVAKQIEKAGDEYFTCRSAEESILRRMLRDQGAAEDAAQALSGKDFSDLDYGRLFNAIQDVIRRNQRIDAVTVENSIGNLFPKRAKVLREKLVLLSKYKEYSDDDSHGIEDHITIVRALAVRRNVSKSLDELVKGVHDPTKDINETLSAIRDTVDNSGVETGKSMSLQEVLINTFEYLERRQKGEIKAITSGLSNLDKLIGGFYGGEMTVIGARPSVGKSAFAQSIALAAAKAGNKIGFVSCEMVDIGFGQRILANRAHVDGMAIRRGEITADAWADMATAMAEVGNLPIEFKFDTTFVEDIVQWASRCVRRGEMDMLIVDYLQLMDTRKRFDSDHLRVGYISRMLKKLATQCNIPVIALAQVNRETDGSMPTLKHLKDSGSIEQDCDNVMFLHRPKDDHDPCIDPNNVPNFAEMAMRGWIYMCIGVAKQRQGAIGKVDVAYKPMYTEFTPMTNVTGG